ncbi:hypothetical protein [Methylobacterium brachythecii]|nr:hypothetical protein [Methylobacterium brachythecii]MBB3905090.1 hypothetical protein [Methylobacterium brachythecii]
MNDEQLAVLAATVEVLGGAVQLMMGARIKDAPENQRQELANLIEGHLSSPTAQPEPLSDFEAVAFSDFDVHREQIAQRLMDGARRLAGLEPPARPEAHRE